MSIQMFRRPWTEEKVDTLHEWWPHFGTYGVQELLPDLTRRQIKSKVNKLKLVLLPKEKRICIACKKRYQQIRRYGLRCKECYLAKRKDVRCSAKYSFEEWMKEVARSCRYRSLTHRMGASDIDADFLTTLWHKQDGLCAYSGVPMEIPQYKRNRSMYRASLDRKDSNMPYTKDNVLWCCWGCNAGKSDFSAADYIKLCRAVVSYQDSV